MSKPPTDQSFVISVLGLVKGLTDKEIGARAGFDLRKVYKLLQADRMDEHEYRRLLAGAEGTPAQEAVARICFETLTSLSSDREFLPQDLETLELSALSAWRAYRNLLKEALRRSQGQPALDRYPERNEIEPARWWASKYLKVLEDYSWARRLSLVRKQEELQTWAVSELAVERSVEAASRDLRDAAGWARLAWEAARRVKGPEGWCNRVKGLSRAAWPNVLRVSGKLKAADAEFPKAKRLWLAGWDPQRILDSGRILGFEASLRRDQRQFEPALDLLDQALPLTRNPARILINKGFTLEVMGEHHRAIETLLLAEDRLDRQAEPRLWITLRFNLAVNYCQLGNHEKAASLLDEARPIAEAFGDEIVLVRLRWLDARIAAGVGRRDDARKLLSDARQAFAVRKMMTDAALTLVEESALLLKDGQSPDTRILSGDVAVLLESEGLHQEALAALRLRDESQRHESSFHG